MVVDRMLDFFGIEMLRPLRHPNFKGSRHTVAYLCRGREGFYLKTTNQLVTDGCLELKCRKSGCGWKLDFDIDASSQAQLGGTEPVVKDGKQKGFISPERYTKLDDETRQKVVAAFKD